MIEFIRNLDHSIFLKLNALAGVSAWRDVWIIFFADYLLYWFIAGLTLFLVLIFVKRFADYRRKNLKLVIFALASAFLSRGIITELIRFFYHRPRPFNVYFAHRLLLENEWSFPSGHTAFSFAVATAVSFFYPKTGIVFFAAAALMGLARIMAGVHWPSDILGGAIIGVASACFLRMFLKRKGFDV